LGRGTGSVGGEGGNTESLVLELNANSQITSAEFGGKRGKGSSTGLSGSKGLAVLNFPLRRSKVGGGKEQRKEWNLVI
jgi:hypothetical protein